jgi:hypothetical protein
MREKRVSNWNGYDQTKKEEQKMTSSTYEKAPAPPEKEAVTEESDERHPERINHRQRRTQRQIKREMRH